MNWACAGKSHCSRAVNTAFFGDPCGYEEFLRVVCRCVSGTVKIALFHHKLQHAHDVIQEAQLSPRHRAMRRVS